MQQVSADGSLLDACASFRNFYALHGLNRLTKVAPKPCPRIQIEGIGMLNLRQLIPVALVIGMNIPVSARADSKTFLTQYCVQCHGAQKPKANLSLQALTDIPVKKSEI